MLKTLLLKLFFLLCTLLICINLAEMIPEQFFTLDCLVQFSLLVICIEFFLSIPLPSTIDHEIKTEGMNSLNFSSLSHPFLSKVGISTLAIAFLAKALVV